MTHRLIYSTAIAVVIIAGIVSGVFNLPAEQSSSNASSKSQESREYCRIISLSPSITETLFALDLGKKIVGVTKFCTYPPAALKKSKVGGYYDPNYEAIIALKPDLVVLLTSHRKSEQYLKRLNLNLLVVNHENISGIMDSIKTMGVACGAEDRAAQIADKIRKKMRRVREKTKSLPRPRVLVAVDRNVSSGSFKELCVSGRGTFYDEMLGLAGGVNAYDGPDVQYPVLSAEGLISIDPDIIIEMIPDLKEKKLDQKTILNQWETLPYLKAVKNSSVYICSQPFSAVPGPRFILILEEMLKAIHPELNLEQR